ncbi:hypothetical protein L2E82_06029 [Cichorium intybus]|uniref:Uncharacterized protein n=1 Tax=Cichorium intybus TaxID=13427 RepID=A0ACB9H8G8_CICIN|nr:hypothetical protein L2E82_06029 [Cichorium intybus]
MLTFLSQSFQTNKNQPRILSLNLPISSNLLISRPIFSAIVEGTPFSPSFPPDVKIPNPQININHDVESKWLQEQKEISNVNFSYDVILDIKMEADCLLQSQIYTNKHRHTQAQSHTIFIYSIFFM